MKDKIKQWASNTGYIYPEDFINAVKDCIQYLGLSNEWVSVDTEKPEINACVDAWGYITAGYNQGDSGRWEDVFYNKEKDFWFYYDENSEFQIISGFEITHWQPLPLPPSEAKS